jgi:hypothetical protein
VLDIARIGPAMSLSMEPVRALEIVISASIIPPAGRPAASPA